MSDSATLWIVCSPPVHGILQTKILEWVAISSCRGSYPPGDEPESPAMQADSLLLSHQGSLRQKNTPQNSEGFFWFYNYVAVNYLGFNLCFHYYPHYIGRFSMLAGLVLL